MIPGLGAVTASEVDGILVRIDLGACRNSQTSPALEDFRQQLEAWSRGELQDFQCAWALESVTDFTRKILSACARIPYGKFETYSSLAAMAGKPMACRAVGGALGRNPLPILIPCHRVMAAKGIGGFSAGLDWKRRLLAIEAGLPQSFSDSMQSP
ncbi:MAG: hypothetical protein RL318_2427 [Fibrobacterota bacterium]|jgi:O-6-methylguanine DNA methyltransferase